MSSEEEKCSNESHGVDGVDGVDVSSSRDSDVHQGHVPDKEDATNEDLEQAVRAEDECEDECIICLDLLSSEPW